MAWYWWALLIVTILIGLSYYSTKRKRDYLMGKYRNSELVEKLMGGKFWQGQSKEQLLDSLGKPLDIDQMVLKTKTKETWKYNSTGKNRYALRIMLENDEVVGWEQK